MRRLTLALLAATTLSSAAMAQTAASPFGAPSTPLTQQELSAIKAEGAAKREAARKAAARAEAKREAAIKAKAEAKAAAEAAALEKQKAADSTSAPAPVSTPEVINAAPAPVGATSDTTTIIQPGTAPAVADPLAPVAGEAPAAGLPTEVAPAVPAEGLAPAVDPAAPADAGTVVAPTE